MSLLQSRQKVLSRLVQKYSSSRAGGGNGSGNGSGIGVSGRCIRIGNTNNHHNDNTQILQIIMNRRSMRVSSSTTTSNQYYLQPEQQQQQPEQQQQQQQQQQYHDSKFETTKKAFINDRLLEQSKKMMIIICSNLIHDPTCGNVMSISSRNFSSSSTTHEKNDKETKDEEEETTTNNNNNDKKESFEETIKRLQNDKNDSSSTSNSTSSSSDDVLRNLSSTFTSFTTSLSETWEELIHSNQPKDVNKKISDIHRSSSEGYNKYEDDNEAADKYEGTTAVMIIDKEENLNAYERIQKRLSEAPLIQDIFKKADEIYEKSGASQAREKISHVAEDAREAWETSQNPWVYRVSSVYDTITAESDESMAERELRILDPTFSLEEWKRGLVEVTLPNIMSMFLEGRIKDLKPYLGEAVYNRLAAESRARKKEGVYIDTNVLGIMNSSILNIMPDTVEKGSPIITLHFMCQQINCVRKKETNEVVEGNEDDIRAYSYIVAMQREYDEEKGELNWKIQDFMLNGATAYL